MPRKNKPHSERRRKTKRYRNKTIRLEQEPKQSKYKSRDFVDEVEDFGWEEYSERFDDSVGLWR
jgi:hypothetical protein